jgi:hypothetical protein
VKSKRTRWGSTRAPSKEAAPKSLPKSVLPSLPLAVQDAPVVPPLTSPANLDGRPKCPRCGTLILNYLRRYCTSCGIPIPLAVRDPSKAHLPASVAIDDDSLMRDKAVKVVMLRQAGLTDAEISPIVGLKTTTIQNYVHIAGANGWLDDILVVPQDRMDYQIFNKVVNRLDEALDSDAVLNTGMMERTAVALKIGEGSLFNRPAEVNQAPVTATMVGVKIEVVGGEPQQMRAGTILGGATYLEAEPVK